MKKTILFLFLLTSLLAACGASPEFLDKTSWDLVSYGPVDTPAMALTGVETTISFDGDGNLNGNIGCNSFFATYKLSGDTLEVGPIVATEMYCEETWEQEMGVFQILGGKMSFEQEGGMLKLFSEDGTQIVQLQQAR